mmetsp:Transcript_10676/g.15874  ORF Transcript_10676/g.15874 Transcript_10676/m.15874 type:complete len:201 (-) Transcript_10676:64-666(-)
MAAHVNFSTVTIRHYAVCLNDNPSCYDGLSIGLDWAYNVALDQVDIDDYEASRVSFLDHRDENIEMLEDDENSAYLSMIHNNSSPLDLPKGYWYEGTTISNANNNYNYESAKVATKANYFVRSKSRKTKDAKHHHSMRNHAKHLLLSRDDRAMIMRHIWGYSDEEIEDAVHENLRYLKTLHTVYEIYLKRQLCRQAIGTS